MFREEEAEEFFFASNFFSGLFLCIADGWYFAVKGQTFHAKNLVGTNSVFAAQGEKDAVRLLKSREIPFLLLAEERR